MRIDDGDRRLAGSRSAGGGFLGRSRGMQEGGGRGDAGRRNQETATGQLSIHG